MRVVALVENSKLEGREELTAEHGLSLYIEREGGNILFDTGASDAFGRNAVKLGVDLQGVEAAVLSHHHYDHGGGLGHFFGVNAGAKVYLQKSDDGDRYFRALGILNKYIGLDKSLVQRHANRFEYLDDFTEILPGVYIITSIPHQYPLPKGNRRLFVKKGGRYSQDNFEHELILVVREGEKLVVFTGCSHNGVLNMVAAVTSRFPDTPIKALFGGFHLVDLPILNTMAGSKTQVRSIGQELLTYPVERVFSGHCTGMKAFRVLKEVMAEKLEHFPTGSELLL